MEGQFQVNQGNWTTVQQSRATVPSADPDRHSFSWQFVNEFQRLLGEESEPDPLFFVESWTAGLPAAVEGLKRRQQPNRERQRSTSRESDDFLTISSALEGAIDSDHASPAPPADRWDVGGRSWHIPAYAVAQQRDQGLDPGPNGPAADWDLSSGEFGCVLDAMHPMTLLRACRLLGVTETSSPRQIKAAYKRLATEWHPDRAERLTEEARQLATRRMAALNEAYRLLRAVPALQPA
jgi:DnaJ-domain-containing protein 1